MISASDLPIEVCEEIFQHLKRMNDLYACITVCKTWYDADIQVYYNSKDLIISSSKIGFLKTKLMLKDNEQDQTFSNG
jgi:hypothetical protein